MIKRLLSVAVYSTTFAKFVTLLEQVGSRNPNLLPVLTYHRVDKPETHPALYPGLIGATPEIFDQQMRYLAAHYHVVSAPELFEVYQNRAILPPRSVMVTFDDAYADFAEHAWPILKHYRLPVTLFVPTAFPDQPTQTFWWDRLYQALHDATGLDQINTPLGRLSLATGLQRVQTFKRLRDYVKVLSHDEAMALVTQICHDLDVPPAEHRVLGWEALRRLAAEGVALGAHTQTHPLLNHIPSEQLQTEILGSLQDLQREIGQVLPIFAYPGGGLNDEVVKVLEGTGFALAFTTIRGINNLQQVDWLRLRRINVGQATTLPVLRAQLLPWSVYFNRNGASRH